MSDANRTPGEVERPPWRWDPAASVLENLQKLAVDCLMRGVHPYQFRVSPQSWVYLQRALGLGRPGQWYVRQAFTARPSTAIDLATPGGAVRVVADVGVGDEAAEVDGGSVAWNANGDGLEAAIVLHPDGSYELIAHIDVQVRGELRDVLASVPGPLMESATAALMGGA